MNRFRFADLRRLQRDILPYRRMLLSLDVTVEQADRDWREYLVPLSRSSWCGAWSLSAGSIRPRRIGS